MGVLVTCKNEEDPFKNEGTRVEWSQQISKRKSIQIFHDAQVKLTPQYEVDTTLNSNSCKLLWLSLLPARMKKIQN